MSHNTYEGILFFALKSSIISLQTDRWTDMMKRESRDKGQRL